jgi:putative FmdB family regulatory protein
MPTYDYECRKCKAQFEVSMTLKDKESKSPVCPNCKSTDTYQIFSKATFVDDMRTPEPPPEMPPGGGMPGMGGMPPGMCGGGMCPPF